MKLATLKKKKKTTHTQNMINANEPNWRETCSERKTKTPLEAQLEQNGVHWEEGPFSSFSPFYKCQMFQALSSLLILCTQYGNTGGIWRKGKFQNGRICNRSFPRILVAEFQIRTSYSRTCTEKAGRRQVKMMQGTVRLDEQNKYLFSSNITHIKV